MWICLKIMGKALSICWWIRISLIQKKAFGGIPYSQTHPNNIRLCLDSFTDTYMQHTCVIYVTLFSWLNHALCWKKHTILTFHTHPYLISLVIFPLHSCKIVAVPSFTHDHDKNCQLVGNLCIAVYIYIYIFIYTHTHLLTINQINQ